MFAVLSFSYQVTDTKTYTQKINLNVVQISLNIQTENKNLNTLLNKISKIINQTKSLCQSSYNFYPVYEKNNFKYYKTNINLKCKFKKEKINEFSKILNNLQTKSKIRMNSINLLPSESEKKEALRKLRKKAYNEAKKNADKLSTTLNKQCFVTEIYFNNSKPPIKTFRPLYKTITLTPIPKQKNSIYLKVFYKIECY